MAAILEARSLTRTFGRGRSQVRAVDRVSLRVEPGELVMIAGPSGSGKTTLVSMLGCLLEPSAGEVLIGGERVRFDDGRALARLRARRIGFVFQAFNLLEPLTVRENVMLPAGIAGHGGREARARATALLDRLGLRDRERALPRTLSGGEKQRVAVARALINEPPIVIADEPTGNLDSHNGQEVMMILHDIARDHGCAIIVVTHDPRIEDVADRVMWLEDGVLSDRRAEQHEHARDPVCGMRVDVWTATHRIRYRDRDLVFCSERCLRRFESEPGRYA